MKHIVEKEDNKLVVAVVFSSVPNLLLSPLYVCSQGSSLETLLPACSNQGTPK